jgi:hypothetical protein
MPDRRNGFGGGYPVACLRAPGCASRTGPEARTEPAVLTLALRDIIPALSEDGMMTEQMLDKHLQFMLEDGQISSTPSAKEGLLWTNRYIVD